MLKLITIFFIGLMFQSAHATTYTDDATQQKKGVVVIKPKSSPTYNGTTTPYNSRYHSKKEKNIHVDGHWRETKNGKVWVNGHYRSRRTQK